MSAPAIPLRIRQNIRDQITDSDAPLHTTTAKLSSTLGYSVSFDPEWGMLWTALRAYYPDQATFIPNVVSVIQTWCEAFTTWLEDDANEEAVERMLDGLKGAGKLKIDLDVAASSPRPTTAWRPSTRSFVICLPKSRPPFNAHSTHASFSTDLSHLFTNSPSLLPVPSPSDPSLVSASASISRTSTSALDDWSDLGAGDPSAHQPSTTSRIRPTAAESMRAAAAGGGLSRIAEHNPNDDDADDDANADPEPLPDVSALPRPEELLQSPPYHLLIQQQTPTRVLISGTHMGTLKLLETYLTRWVRGDVGYVNRPPLVEVKLRESGFGLGLLWDGVVVDGAPRSGMRTGSAGKEVSALLVVKVVEGWLGYRRVVGGEVRAGEVWEFRRGRAFRDG